MSTKQVVIKFEGPDEWQNQWENVNKTLEELTGTDAYPATKSLPPIIFGVQVNDEGIAKLRGLKGVIVDIPDEE